MVTGIGLRPENGKLSEIHTDNGTLGVLSKIVASCDPHGLGKNVDPVKISAATFYDMLDVLKSQARGFENRLVVATEKQVNLVVNNLRAKNSDSVNGTGAGGVNPNALAARINRLLNNSHIRRGVAVSQQELARRSSLLVDRAACGQPLQYALLLLPFRGQCAFKQAGVLPDLGEMISLLRLWAIGSAFSRLVENKRAALEAILSEMGRASVDQIVRFDGVGGNLDATCNDLILQAKAGYKRTTLANTLDYRGAAMSVGDKNAFSILAMKMRKRDLTLSDLLMLRCNPIDNCYILGLRDGERYASFEATPAAIKRDYGAALDFIVEKLNLPSTTQLRVLPETIPEAAALERRVAYQESFNSLMTAVAPKRRELAAAKSPRQFTQVLANIDPYDNRFQYIARIYESVLLSLHSERISDYFAEHYYDYGDKAVFYASLYERDGQDSARDEVKEALLWQGVVGAVKYVSSYYANAREYNRFAFDDVEQAAPGALRATIHRKPESTGQPCLSLGPNPHRTPWHGTAAILKNPRANRYTHATLLDIECKNRRLRPVLIESCNRVGSALEAEEAGTIKLMAQMRYPICYVEADNQADLESGLDIKSILMNTKCF